MSKLPAWLAPRVQFKNPQTITDPVERAVHYREMGRLGGFKRFANMTMRERNTFAKQGGRAAVNLLNAKLTPEEHAANSSKAGKANIARMTRAEVLEFASMGGKAAAAKMTPEERSASARRANAARNAKMTPEERREIGRRGGLATAAKRRAAA